MDLVGNIERDNRDVILPGELEDRLQQTEIQLPALEVLGLNQHLPFGDASRDVIVQVGLKRLLKIFDADGEVGVACIHAFDDVQLIAVMFQPVVNFTDEDHAVLGQLPGQFPELPRIAGVYYFGIDI